MREIPISPLKHPLSLSLSVSPTLCLPLSFPRTRKRDVKIFPERSREIYQRSAVPRGINIGFRISQNLWTQEWFLFWKDVCNSIHLLRETLFFNANHLSSERKPTDFKNACALPQRSVFIEQKQHFDICNVNDHTSQGQKKAWRYIYTHTVHPKHTAQTWTTSILSFVTLRIHSCLHTHINSTYINMTPWVDYHVKSWINVCVYDKECNGGPCRKAMHHDNKILTGHPLKAFCVCVFFFTSVCAVTMFLFYSSC